MYFQCNDNERELMIFSDKDSPSPLLSLANRGQNFIFDDGSKIYHLISIQLLFVLSKIAASCIASWTYSKRKIEIVYIFFVINRKSVMNSVKVVYINLAFLFLFYMFATFFSTTQTDQPLLSTQSLSSTKAGALLSSFLSDVGRS